jgi:acetyltransferase-like isoleucine patch superfamily enzyme
MYSSDEQGDFRWPMSARDMIQACLDAPWRVMNELRRLISLPYIRLAFALHGVAWRRGWRVFGMPIIQRHRGSSIELGDGLQLRSWYSTNPLAPNHPVVLATRSEHAVITVGNKCGFTGATIVAVERVEIGDRVTIGANAVIVDTDFHPLDPVERLRNPLGGKHRPVVVEEDVFIGMNSLVLKGVTVGRDSVIGAGSVVSRDVPSGAVVAGNPARVVGKAKE